jgi:hypothetical protein
MASLDLPEASLDLATAFYSIIHVPKEEHSSVLRRVTSWLQPGGFLLLNMGGSERSWTGVEDDWLGGAPMYWSNWDVLTNRGLIADTGLEVLACDVESDFEDGREVNFLWVIARKPGGNMEFG